MAENLLHLGAHFNQPQWTQQAKAMVQAMQSKNTTVAKKLQ